MNAKREGRIFPSLRIPKEAFDLAKLAIAGPDASVAGGIKLRLCNTPVVDATGVSFELGATVELTGPRRSEAIDGPPTTRGKVAPLAFPPAAKSQGTDNPAVGDLGENLDAVASAEALQRCQSCQAWLHTWIGQRGAFEYAPTSITPLPWRE